VAKAFILLKCKPRFPFTRFLASLQRENEKINKMSVFENSEMIGQETLNLVALRKFVDIFLISPKTNTNDGYFT
jgi:hypothetical protein